MSSSGRDFVAVVRLTNKAGDAVFAQPGETCERVPAASLEWLERSGRIKRSAPAPRPETASAVRAVRRTKAEEEG